MGEVRFVTHTASCQHRDIIEDAIRQALEAQPGVWTVAITDRVAEAPWTLTIQGSGGFSLSASFAGEAHQDPEYIERTIRNAIAEWWRPAAP